MQTRLSALRIKAIKEPGRYGDSNCLYLVVSASGAKCWVCRLVIRGRRCDLGLGSVQNVSLADARDVAYELRKRARSGGDPLRERSNRKRRSPTFEEACESVFEQWRPSFHSTKHATQWISSLRTYAYPTLASMTVDTIETHHIHPCFRTYGQRRRKQRDD